MKMKNKKYNYSVITLITAIIMIWSLSCKRDFDKLEQAKFPNTPEVFIDGFSAGLNYAAFGGSKVTAFDVDQEVKFSGSASMKIEVPDAGDPEGAYAGGVYYTTEGRDLSEYDALTFWAKASKSATIDLLGFGNDLGESKYLVSLESVAVNSNWKKYIIPIPDPSKLTEERGMFYYSEGPEEGLGYTFWIDEVKFEKLGTIAHKQAQIEDGMDVVESTFNGLEIAVSGLSVSFNMPTGIDKTFLVAPAYFTFSSSNTGVATVDASGMVSVVSAGTAVITAKSGDEDAAGSLTIESAGDYTSAPVPTKDQEDVISIFSNAYTNVPVEFYNGYWEPYQTTLSADFTIGDDDVLYYTNFNFVGIQFSSPSIDASSMTHLHMDVYIPNAVDPADRLQVTVKDMGPDGTLDDGNDPSITYVVPFPMASQSWISVDIDLSGLPGKSKLAQLVLENLSTGLSGFYLDNVYLYGDGGGTPTGPAEAAPTPPVRDAGDVISVYGDEYTNLAGTDYPDWGQATVVSDVDIAGNTTLKFSGLNFQGIQFASSQDVSGMEFLHLDFWTANSTALSLFLISPGPAETAKVLTVPTTGWTSMDIPLTDFSAVNLADLIQMKFDGNGDIYLDNIYFFTSGGGTVTGPSAAAPTPPERDAADVVSLFSNAYADVPVDTWSADWDDSDVSDLQVTGDDIKKYSFTNFAGIDFSSNKLDASEMTHFHMDIWTPDEVQDKSLTVKMVDFGGGVAEASHFILTVTHTSSGDIPALAIGTWVSIDVPFTAFTGDLTRTDLAQLVLSSNLGTVYIDNLYLYKSGGASATEPTVSAPIPTHDPGDVYSLFSDAYTNTLPSVFSEGWGEGAVADFQVGTDNMKKYSDLNFQAISLSETVDLSAYTHIHIDVWTPIANKFGIKLQDFGADDTDEYPNVDDSEFELESSTAQIAQTWVSHDFAIADFTGLTGIANVGQLQVLLGSIAGGTTGTAFIDNIYFYNDGGGGTCDDPIAAPPAPQEDAADVISVFSDAYTDIAGTNFNPGWGQSTVVTTESIGGGSTLKYDVFDYQGTNLGGADGVDQDLSSMEYLHIDMWTCDATVVQVTPISRTTGESLVSLTPITTGQWNSYDIPLSDFTGVSMADIFQLKFDGQAGTTPSKIFIDNIYFYTTGGGSGDTGPATAAPTPPARNADDVISLFSGEYTDVQIDNWDADWGNICTLENIQVEGDDIKKYVCDAFAAVDFSGNKFDASAMTHFHIDVWTPTAVLDKSLTVKLVDFGGGSAEATNFILTVVHTTVGDVEALEQGAWVSVDVPISAFSGDPTRTDLAQMALTTNLGTIYVDNIYFYK